MCAGRPSDGEAIALRVKDIGWETESLRVMGSVDPVAGRGTTKGGKGRSVPLVLELAQALSRLLDSTERTDEDPVFVGDNGDVDGSALRRRFRAAQKRAGLRPIRFHDLRHTFGSLAIDVANIVEVQAWMGHADIKTTMRYLHHKCRAGEAQRLAAAFQVDDPLQAELQANEVREPAAAFRAVQPTDDETPAQGSLSWNAAEAV